MRVAYVGNFEPPYSTESDVRWTLEDMGHQVTPIQESRVDWTNLPALVEGADLFAWTRTGGFDPADEEGQRRAVGEVKLLMPTVGFHLDRWWGLYRQSAERGPTSANPTPFFGLDYLFTADGDHPDEWASVGANHYWSPPAIARRNLGRGRFRRHLWAEVGFVGNIRNYGHAEWAEYRRELHRRLSGLPRFRIWEGGVRGQLLADVYASVEVLVGDSCLVPNARGGPMAWYMSDRIPETLGRGGFLIHPDVVGLRDLYPEEVLTTYPLGDFDRLVEQVIGYIDDRETREVMADAGLWWVGEHHTYHHRWQRILDVVFGGAT